MRAIDFRLRPPYRSYLNNSVMYDYEALQKSHKMRDIGEVSPAAMEKSMELLIQEMNDAGIVYGVAPVRVPTDGDNDDAVRLMEEYPERFLGIPWIDPLHTEEALQQIEKYVVNGPCKGIIVEPAIKTTPEKWFVDDERVFPVYEKCQQEKIPVLMSFGGRLADPIYYEPRLMYNVAQVFPDLIMVTCHGGWPRVTEMCYVAAECANVYISADSWMMSFAPGAEAYVTAANYILQDKIVFGTSYPAMRLPLAVEDYVKRLRPEVVDKIMYLNGAKIFGLEE